MVVCDPLEEEAYRTLMRLYAANGQPSAALRQYQELERILQKELGETPSDETRQLMETLRQSPPAPRRASEPPVLSSAPLPASPPPGPVSFPSVPVETPVPAKRPSLPVLFAGIVALTSLFLWLKPRLHSQPSVPHRKSDSATPKAASPSNESWRQRYDLEPGDKGCEPTAMTTDVYRNIYMTGFVDTHDHDVDYLTLSFYPNGRLHWKARYNGPGNDVDRARCIAVDGAGNVYVTGDSDNGKGNGKTRLAGLDIATIKYGPDGKPSPTWPDVGYGVGVRRYNGPDDGEDRPVGMAVRNGNVYVLGASWGKGKTGRSGFNYALVKYNASGERKWVKRYDGGYGSDVPAALTLDLDENVIVTGTSRDEPPSGPETDIVTIKYDKNGREHWLRRFGKDNHADDVAMAIGRDKGGNIYVASSALGAPNTPDAGRIGALCFSYDFKGLLRWIRGTVSAKDRIQHLQCAKIDADANIMMVGIGQDEPGNFVTRTVLRGPDGMLRWARDHYIGLDTPAVDNWGKLVYVCGGYRPGNIPEYLGTSRYDMEDEGAHEYTYQDPKGLRGKVALTVDNQACFIVTSQSNDGHLDIIKYHP